MLKSDIYIKADMRPLELYTAYNNRLNTGIITAFKEYITCTKRR
jgi:hypothetical protein